MNHRSLTAINFLFLIFSNAEDMFDIYATVDIAAESNKISGNELRDIIYSEVKTYQKIGEHTVDLREFSITNLEGKLSFKLSRETASSSSYSYGK